VEILQKYIEEIEELIQYGLNLAAMGFITRTAALKMNNVIYSGFQPMTA
jgi:hypothetical protein